MYKDFILNLLPTIQQITKKYFKNNYQLESKENQTPVTIADKQIEKYIRQQITQTYPKHGIIGEEEENINMDAEYLWVIDPIDGTVAFSTGKPLFTTLIALYKNNEPIISIIYQPISDELTIYCDKQATYNNNLIKTSQVKCLTKAKLSLTTPYMFKNLYEQNILNALAKKCLLTSFGGDAYSYSLLAQGQIDIILESDLQYYDIAALIPIIESAGGTITNWSGEKLTKDFDGRVLAAANINLHQQALKLII